MTSYLVTIATDSHQAYDKMSLKDRCTATNHILLLGKYYIYVRKCHGSLPSLRGFIARIRRVYNIEVHIARERNKLTTHFKKWEKLVAVVNTQQKITLLYLVGLLHFQLTTICFVFNFFVTCTLIKLL